MNCNICPRNCNINRENNKGFCKENNTLTIARAALHHFEEPVISGTNGSGAVFFCGCNLNCKYCQNADISSAKNNGREVNKAELKEIFNVLIEQKAHNINLVTPTHFSNILSECLEEKLSVPVIWNSNAYEKPETIEQLKNKVDVFLPDFKYADNRLAKELSFADNYFEIATKAIDKMLEITGPLEIEDGLIKRGVIIRHLVLPGFIENTKKVIDYVAKNYKNDALFSLMFQYVPIKEMQEISLNRRVSKKEYDEVLEHLYNRGIENGFVQSRASSSKKYIPDFTDFGLK